MYHTRPYTCKFPCSISASGQQKLLGALPPKTSASGDSKAAEWPQLSRIAVAMLVAIHLSLSTAEPLAQASPQTAVWQMVDKDK